MSKSVKLYLGALIFSVLVSIPLLIPYFHSGYFPTHDGEWAVVRLSDMFREIQDFQIPPRFSGNLNFGYGYPLFNFAYPFPYYLGLAIHLMGFAFITSIKIVFALTIPISAFFMFLASRSIWKNDYAGIISSVLYLYFPYRLVDLFVRGSIGESIAFALFPMIILCLVKSIEKPKSWGFTIAGGILFACLILSHNIMSVLFAISLLVLFVGYLINERKRVIIPFISVGVLGFGLSAFFWMPALLEKNNILLSVVPISDRNQYFVSIKALLTSKWGYGIPTDPKTGFTYQIGWPFLGILLLTFITIIYGFYKNIKEKKELILAATLLIGILVYSIMLFSISKPLWKIPLLSEINYPWIVLSQLGLLISLLAGYLAKYRVTRYLGVGFCMLALILYVPYARPERFVDRVDGFYFTNDATTTSSNELMPLWVKTHPKSRVEEKVLIVKGKGNIENLISKSNKITFKTDLLENSVIRINTIYYPGWNVIANGKNLEIDYKNEFGVMEIKLPKGQYDVSGKFTETNLRLIADLVSLVSFLAVILWSIKLIYLKIRK